MHHCTIARARAEIGPPKLRAFFGGAPQPISHNKRMPLQERPARAGGDMRRVAGGSAPSPRAVRVAQLAVPHPASSSQMSMARGRRKTYMRRARGGRLEAALAVLCYTLAVSMLCCSL